MINIHIPGFDNLQLNHLVLDYNGTLAEDGRLLPGIGEALTALAKDLEIHVITADTFGLATSELTELPVALTITPVEAQADAKLAYGAGLVFAGITDFCGMNLLLASMSASAA